MSIEPAFKLVDDIDVDVQLNKHQKEILRLKKALLAVKTTIKGNSWTLCDTQGLVQMIDAQLNPPKTKTSRLK